MQFLTSFFFAIVVLVSAACSRPSSVSSEEPAGFLMTDAQLEHWLATTDAELTFVGPRPTFNPLIARAAQNTIVTYCTKRSGDLCTGVCTVYNGGAACIPSDPDTQCLAANKDVGFCTKSECDGTCSSLSLCGTHLLDGFCFTPETKSIVVSPL
ncbi:uncharacterized protein TRAVEDRAFT_47972 [Trametes versicolor FP-101664 SS1]|uniref:uncharacterized protein n=1 Tax=Trametes versicolor (strain FP-101664) TaxID=717944 RepID=UPI000462309B|nr:uncharacterized protein TRAVEDRAFT_47972 [Trametes versicolor FP-101664 SS1]EIW58829.1 hypothetical protein TRAVEDRAFT_47972 [Trametes versicolor FP-101664 SS1]